MPWEIRYTHIAAKPFKAEHPVGSGTVVQYNPGDEVPASEWGAATGNMLEMGRIFQTAINVWVGDDEPDTVLGGGGDAPEEVVTPAEAPADDDATPGESEDDAAAEDVVDDTVYPVHAGGGNYRLSDGSRVKSKQAAFSAQAALNTAAEEA